MPISIFKGSFDYCFKNKSFLLLVLILLFIISVVNDSLNSSFSWVGTIVFGVLVTGYGLQIIEDIINGGVRLPKIMPKKVLIYGIKGMCTRLFYIFIQVVLLSIVSDYLNFPIFDVEDVFVNYFEFIRLLFNHDIGSFVIFLISGFAVSYVTIFFMELSLARLADGGRLKESFNFPRIKHAIDVIGWRRYTVAYTKIILVISILTHVNFFFSQFDYINIIASTLIYLISFVVEYRGMGNVYKVYTSKKNQAID